jgi:hypothetical protein
MGKGVSYLIRQRTLFLNVQVQTSGTPDLERPLVPGGDITDGRLEAAVQRDRYYDRARPAGHRDQEAKALGFLRSLVYRGVNACLAEGHAVLIR